MQDDGWESSGIAGFVVRPAALGDVERLVELRAEMLATLGSSVGDCAAAWRPAAREWFCDALERRAEVRIAVIDLAGEGVVSCGVGMLVRHIPSPSSPGGWHGHLSNMSTLPAYRGRGYGRACLAHLLEWFDDRADLRTIDLNASATAAPMYRAAGFSAPRFEALQRRR